MSAGEFFLDTNVIVYALNPKDSSKQKAAAKLLEKAHAGKGYISLQVVQEFVNLATRKFQPAPPVPEVRQVVEDILLPLCRAIPSPAFLLDALDTHRLTKLSWYDCLILQAAVDAGCGTLYSEDFQDGFHFRGVTIRNPFA
jgi:predicted nucleic acid-binding protein